MTRHHDTATANRQARHTPDATPTPTSRWPGLDAPLSRDPLFWVSILAWGMWVVITEPLQHSPIAAVINVLAGLPSAMLAVGTVAGSIRAFARGFDEHD